MDELTEEKTLIHRYEGRGIFYPQIDIKEYIFKIVAQWGPITRSDLVERTNIPRTTIYDTLVKLMLEERVAKFSLRQSARGRPRVYFKALGELK